MLLRFDIFTMLYMLAIGNLIWFLLYFAYFRFSAKKFAADRYWLIAKLLQAAAWTLLAMRDGIPDFFSVLAGNSALFAGLAAECVAILMAADKLDLRTKSGYVVGTGCGMLLMIYGYLTPGSIKVFIASGVTFLMMAFLGGRLLFAKTDTPFLQKVFGFCVFAISLILLVRTITFSGSNCEYNLFTPMVIHTLSLISMYFLLLISGIGILLILREKVDVELMRESRVDYLTDLPNRRDFLDKAARSIAQCSREKQSVAILVIDLDHFKQVNDQFGHETGDEVLKYLGGYLQVNIREYDVACRMGGEEFAVLLPNVGEGEAVKTAQRIKQERHSVAVNGQDIVFTMSIGVCVADLAIHSVITLTDLLRCGDKGLYQAKKAGKNCIVVEPFDCC
ncbi:MAG: GGDEF domain-containing protein [Negativicutes bacterium]|nr:GGDEF domain-containing protein [Negativicutes bacterium]